MRQKHSGQQGKLTAVKTANISWHGEVPHSTEFSDIYFSGSSPFTDDLADHPDSALNETRYVFLNANQLSTRWDLLDEKASFTIVETGFGTGLNFLAAAQLWLERGPDCGTLHFTSVEKSPLSRQDLSRALKVWPQFSTLGKQLLATYPPPTPGFHKIYLMGENNRRRITLTLIFEDVERALQQLRGSDHPRFNNHNLFTANAWFLDGFAPAKNPDMWTQEVFQSMACLSGEGTTFSTFTAAGMVRRGLQSAGFAVGKVPGFGNKRNMLIGEFRATNLPDSATPTEIVAQKGNAEFPPPWHIDALQTVEAISGDHRHPTTDRQTEQPSPLKEVAIIGGGIAGCTTAHALAQRGWQVTIYESAGALADGASGNPQGIIYPRLSPWASPLSRFNLSALLYAARFYEPYWSARDSSPGDSFDRHSVGQRCGVLVLPEQSTNHKTFANIADNFRGCEEFVSLLDNKQLRAVSGVALNAELALYFPTLGWIKPRQICEHLAGHPNIQVEYAEIKAVNWNSQSNRWSLKAQTSDHSSVACNTTTYSAKTVVLATSHRTSNFEIASHLPLKTIRGQISIAPTSQKSAALRSVICGAGYIAPGDESTHTLGATYNLDTNTEQLRDSDHQLNLNTLADTDPALPTLLNNPEPAQLSGRASLRCATPDYLPIVGPAPVFDDFLDDFAALRDDARANIPQSGSYWPGLYIHCGLGSRGFTYAPLAAELLAGIMNNEPPALPRDLQIALHPGRFIIRDLKRKQV